MKRLSVLLALVLVLSLIFTACQPQAKEEGKAEEKTEVKKEDVKKEEKKEEPKKEEKKAGKIIVYISGPETMIKKLEEKFEAVNGDVIDIYHAGCGQLRQKVWTEAEANNIQADVFWGSNPLIYYMLDEKGFLMPYDPKGADKIKEEYKRSDANFTLTNARYQILVYSKKGVKKEDAPKSYADLLDSKWKGKLAYTDLSQSSTAFALSNALWEMNGKTMKFFEGVKANEALIVPKTKTIAEKIQSGEIEVGIVPFDAIFRLTKKAKKEGFESNLAHAWPSEGAVQIERPIAIIKKESRSKEDTEIAKKFVDFVLSKQAQTMMNKFGFESVRTDVPEVKGSPKDLKYTAINWKGLVKYEKQIREDFRKIMSGK